MKRIIILLVAALGLAVGGAVALIATLDVSRYKPELIKIVEEQTGRNFDIKGDIFLKLSLLPTVAVEHVIFGNAEWAVHETMATVERFEAQAKLLPLFRRRIEIKRLTLIAPRISLEQNKKGVGNWVIEPEEASGPRSKWDILQFDLNKILVEGAVFEYRNASGVHHEAVIDRISLARTRFGQPLALELNALYDGIPIEVAGGIAPISRLLADEPYTLDLAGHIGALAFAINGGIEKPLSAEGASLQFSLAADSLNALGILINRNLSPAGPLSLSGNISDSPHGYRLRGIDLKLGESDLEADAEFELNRKVPRITLKLQSELINLKQIMPVPEERRGETKARVFSADPLPVGPLRGVNAVIDLSVASLVLHDMELRELKAKLSLDRGKLNIAPFEAVMAGGGSISSEITFDASSDIPSLDKRVTVKDLQLSRLPALAEKNLLEGGRTDLVMHIKGNGRSLAEIMAHADGHVRINVGPGKLNNRLLGVAGGDLLLNAFRMLNPLAESDKTTNFECAVFNFPIRDGRAESETAIGIQTDKLNILGGGIVNLESEGIDIGVKPKPREGIGLNLSSLTDFVRVGGTLSQPRPVTDTKGAATAGLKIGAAAATGGLSVLAEGFFDRATSNVDVCDIARGDARLEADKSGNGSTIEHASEATKTAIKDAGSKVKGLFKELFGD